LLNKTLGSTKQTLHHTRKTKETCDARNKADKRVQGVCCVTVSGLKSSFEMIHTSFPFQGSISIGFHDLIMDRTTAAAKAEQDVNAQHIEQ
jgi:hypothetical protein